MIIKINQEIQRKIEFISNNKDINKHILIEKIFNGFFERYEKKFGKIPDKKSKKATSLSYKMYEAFSKVHCFHFGNEYYIDPRQMIVEMKHFKTISKKITELVLQKDSGTMVVEDESILLAWITLLGKLDEWWIQNAFTPKSISKNFDSIIHKIKNGKQTGKQSRNNERKSKIDDFIEQLGKEFAFDNA